MTIEEIMNNLVTLKNEGHFSVSPIGVTLRSVPLITAYSV
jgi:hypothetical protein